MDTPTGYCYKLDLKGSSLEEKEGLILLATVGLE